MRARAVMAVVGAVMLAACGAQGGGSAAGDGIGIFMDAPIQSSTFSAPFMQDSAQAAIDAINAEGGINGRNLELTVCNNAFDANTALKCTQDAVGDDSIVAQVGSLTAFGPQTNPILEAAGMATVGPNALSPSDATSPVAFLLDPGVTGYGAMPTVAKKYLNADQVALFIVENASADAIRNFFAVGAKAAGVTIVNTTIVPADVTDYTQYISKAQDDGAEAILSSMPPPFNLGTWSTLQSLQSELKVVTSASGVSQPMLDEAGPAAVEGSYTINAVPNPVQDDPTGAAYIAEMAKYSPDTKVLDGVGLRAWAAVHLFAEVARTIEGPVTRESALAAFNGVHDLEFLWIPSLSFDEPGPVAEYPRVVSPLTFPARLTGGTFERLPEFNPFEGS